MHRIILALTATALLAPVALAQDAAPEKKMDIGMKAPAVDITHYVKGEPVTFEKDKVYVVEFWATWCGPCKAGMEHLSTLQEKWQDYGVTILGVSDEPLHKVVHFLWTKWTDGEYQWNRTRYTLATDPDKSVYNDYFKAAGLRGIPSAFIVGKTGVVEWIGHPMNMDTALEAVVRGTWDREAFKLARTFKAQNDEKLRSAMAAGDYTAVLGIYSKVLDANPKDLDALTQTFMIALTKADNPKLAYDAARTAMEVGKDNSGLMNMIAWTIADDPNVSQRDLGLAMKAATRAVELTKEKDPATLDTLARVYYESGKLKEAIAWQKKAVALAGDDRMGAGIKDALAKYEAELKGK